jgi:hypothetical protein
MDMHVHKTWDYDAGFRIKHVRRNASCRCCLRPQVQLLSEEFFQYIIKASGVCVCVFGAILGKLGRQRTRKKLNVDIIVLPEHHQAGQELLHPRRGHDGHPATAPAHIQPGHCK